MSGRGAADGLSGDTFGDGAVGDDPEAEVRALLAEEERLDELRGSAPAARAASVRPLQVPASLTAPAVPRPAPAAEDRPAAPSGTTDDGPTTVPATSRGTGATAPPPSPSPPGRGKGTKARKGAAPVPQPDQEPPAPGHRRGSRVTLTLNLTRRCGQALRDEASSSGRYLGEVLVAAVRAHHRDLGAVVAPDPDDPFPPEPPRTRRLSVPEPTTVQLNVSPAQAQVVRDLSRRSGMDNLSAFAEAVLRPYLHLPPDDEGPAPTA